MYRAEPDELSSRQQLPDIQDVQRFRIESLIGFKEPVPVQSA
jgi:hypothetical protein